ncbi:hypothetical protein D3C87_1682670 [compost metagenome]
MIFRETLGAVEAVYLLEITPLQAGQDRPWVSSVEFQCFGDQLSSLGLADHMGKTSESTYILLIKGKRMPILSFGGLDLSVPAA